MIEGLNPDYVPIYTRCDKVHFIQVKSGYDKGIPILVSLINSFLHFQTSPYMLSNISFSQHLHGVVAHFANLGRIARNYLLKTRTLPRLLRLLLTYNNSANLPPEQVSDDIILNTRVPIIDVVRDADKNGTRYLSANMMRYF